MIHREAWYRESLERELSALLRAHQADPTLDTAREVWRVYTRVGRLPPIKFDWVEELKNEGEEMPEFETQTSSLPYVIELQHEDDPESGMWVPWEYGEDKKRPVTMSV